MSGGAVVYNNVFDMKKWGFQNNAWNSILPILESGMVGIKEVMMVLLVL